MGRTDILSSVSIRGRLFRLADKSWTIGYAYATFPYSLLRWNLTLQSTSKMKLFFILFLTTAYAQNYPGCRPERCADIQCVPKTCGGGYRLEEGAGYCGCCPHCVKQAGKRYTVAWFILWYSIEKEIALLLSGQRLGTALRNALILYQNKTARKLWLVVCIRPIADYFPTTFDTMDHFFLLLQVPTILVVTVVNSSAGGNSRMLDCPWSNICGKSRRLEYPLVTVVSLITRGKSGKLDLPVHCQSRKVRLPVVRAMS